MCSKQINVKIVGVNSTVILTQTIEAKNDEQTTNKQKLLAYHIHQFQFGSVLTVIPVRMIQPLTRK